MSTLQYPNMRAELVSYLEDLSDSARIRSYPREKGDLLDYAINFLFDDTCLADEPAKAIGVFLLDQDEVGVIRRVTQALSSILDSVGATTTEAVLASSEWPTVERAAREALERIVGDSFDA